MNSLPPNPNNIAPMAIPPYGQATALGRYRVSTPEHQMDVPEIYFNDRQLYEETIVDLNPFQRLGHRLHRTFVETPRAMLRGLKGDLDYSFEDFLMLGNIPYYLGGITLAGIFAMGRHGLTLARQGPAITLYYLAYSLAQGGINQYVKYRTGVDLNQQYRTSLGELKPVFGDPTFSRYDLISKESYREMGQKMGIPQTVTDPDDEVQATIAKMLPRIRLAKMVLGNALAVVAAGYLARTDEWFRVFASIPGLRFAQNPIKRSAIFIKDAATVIAHQFGHARHAMGMGLTRGRFKWVQMLSVGMVATALVAAAKLLQPPVDKKPYQNGERENSLLKSQKAASSESMQRFMALWQTDQARELMRHTAEPAARTITAAPIRQGGL